MPLGEIVATHGLDGWLKLNPFNPKSAMITAARQVILEKGGRQSTHEIESSKTHNRQLLIKLRAIDHIGDAESWIGCTLSVDEAALGELAPGEYYLYQTVGLEVVDLQGAHIGVIERIWSTAGRDFYVVRGAAKEHLIPAVKEIVEKIDFAAGQVIINPPQGLLDL